MIRINLLPVRAAQKKEKLRSQVSIFVLCMILVCIACGALYVQKMLAVRDVRDEIALIDKQNKALTKKIGQVRDFEKKQAELENKLEILKKLKDGKSGPVHLLDELSAALPEKLWLTKFSEKSGQINLSGVADNENTVAEFMRNLDASPYYKNIELSVTEQTKAGERKMQKFTLNCSVETPPSE
ncbi:type IV pilus assembly protein PilN [Desulfuromusa kysingii]|uniref:Type IV pilus assembly protein PilN n=1 Tax=Desulfuromusa kysingii TaxID=37625 RepID=A0A1H4CXT0_9BACT|nr:PilN domain-containing protein [Desulfuromusa kysingii]SEA65197.1 type IV pilus assembly protein PilN [Desulfuromusa kysingii]